MIILVREVENFMQTKLVQDSGNVEWYTPSYIIEAARKTMGSIDLDPFSSLEANQNVKAGHIYTQDVNGFEKEWFGNVWCNHPFSRENNQKIFKKAILEFEKGNCKNICMITFASTSEKWFMPSMSYPQCFIHGRVQYMDNTLQIVKGVTKGSVVTYIGKSIESFYSAFKEHGTIKVPYQQGAGYSERHGK